jgi:hypothetical protein
MIHHPLRCLFVHVPKTAGTSLKDRLAGYSPRSPRSDPAGVEALYTHLTAAELRQRLTAAGADPVAYFQFSFVRNPWDRLISAYRYLEAGGSGSVRELPRVAAVKRYRGDFCRFVLEGLEALTAHHPYFQPQHRWTHDGLDPDRPLDFIGRYERLEADFAKVATHLGLPESGPLPRLRHGGHGPYVEAYDDDSRTRVEQVYARDIALFGYSFGA